MTESVTQHSLTNIEMGIVSPSGDDFLHSSSYVGPSLFTRGRMGGGRAESQVFSRCLPKKQLAVLPTPTLATLVALASTPQLASATTIPGVINSFTTALGTFVPVGIALAVLVFAWGVVSMMLAGVDDKSLAEGRKRMIWGVVGLFVIVSIWGLVALLQGLFGVDPAVTKCTSPQVPPGGFDADATCL